MVESACCCWEIFLETLTLKETRFQHRNTTINVGNHSTNLILTAEDEQINEPETSSCLGTDRQNLITHMGEQISAPTNKKYAPRCKGGNFRKLKGIISKKLIREKM